MTSFSRPSLPELVQQVQQDFVSRLNLAGPLLRRSIEYVLSRVIAGSAHMVYGYLQYITAQIFPQTADLPFLLLLGNLRGVSQEAATFARGTATATGTNGTVIPATTVVTRGDGAQFTVDADVTISGGTATPAVTAALAGVAGNCDVGTILSISLAGVNSGLTVVSVGGGNDVEATEAYRTRVVAAWQNPPQGGNETDYQAWARLVAGVTRVWVRPRGNGAGTVVVYFVRDNDPSIIPDGGEVAAVQASLNANAPVGAVSTAYAPVAQAINFSIHLDPSTSAIQAEVLSELTDFFRNQTEPGTQGGTVSVLLSVLRTIVGQAVKLSGGNNYTMAAPAADIVPAVGHLPTMGTITWT